MSRFFSSNFVELTPYTPGEQPKEKKYIKLNTNESPFLPAPAVCEAAKASAASLNLYSDPESTKLTQALAKRFGVDFYNVIATNGSDEALNFAFAAFSDAKNPIVFPDITYGFYPVFARLNRIPYETVSLSCDFKIDYRDYVAINKNIVIANPNAPTGILLPLSEVEEIVKSNPDNVVIIDEAYMDFCDSVLELDDYSSLDGKVWKESAINLVPKYDNLIVTGTFSKSRSLAGGRLGFAIANKDLIADMRTIKYSTNPYNVNSITSACGVAALENDGYYMKNCQTIIKNREYLTCELKNRGFSILPSSSNFVFAKSEKIGGEKLYLELKSAGILVRHFETDKLGQYNRITVGTTSEIDALLKAIDEIIK